jgi:tape measure domain-containing protein
MTESLKVGLVIDGDAGGASKAIGGVEKGLDSLGQNAKETALDLGQAAKAADAIDAAFKTLGVKPLKDVRAETERLQAALATIKGAGIVGADQERAIAGFKAKLAELRSEVSAIPGAANGAKSAIAGISSEAQVAGSAMGGMASKAVSAVAALVGLNTASNIAADIVKTGAAFETLEARLSSLLGSSEAAKTAMGNIKELAITTPFEVSALADSFVKLTAFGLQPSMEQMRAMADTAATLGGGTEALAGVTLALGQAWAKGKLQGDEILQMAERGVPVWDVLSQATGKNTVELQKMSEAGELGRGTIIKLIDALGKMNAGASEKMMATFSGAVSNAKDALAEFYDMIAQAGVLDFLTGQLQDLLAEFERMKKAGELEETAKKIADGFILTAQAVQTAIEAIKALAGVMDNAVKAFIAYRIAAYTLAPALASVGAGATAAAAKTTALAAASTAAATGMSRLATASKAFVASLGWLAVIELAIRATTEFFRAKKEAEDSDRMVKKLFGPVDSNGPAEAAKAVVTETEAARFKLTDYQRALQEMQGQGKATGDVLVDMVKKADLSSVKGISDMLNGLRSIEQGAMATGLQIQASIQDRLNKMTASELSDFGIMAQTAFSRGDISAQQLAATLNGQVDAALKGLGQSLEVSAGGMTAKFIEVSQQIGVVEASYERLKETGQNAGAIIKAAFDGGLNSAKSVQDLEGLAVSIRQAGEAGRLSKQDVADFLDTIRAKVDNATPGINSMTEAFKTLGMASPESLKKAAQSAEEAFNVIRNGSGFTKAELANVSAAFKRYAEAAIAANGGVISDTLKAQAAIYGFSVEIDSAGKAMLKAASAANDAAGGIAALGEEADGAAAKVYGLVESLDSAARSANQPMGSNAGVGRPGASGGFDLYTELGKIGATDEQIKSASSEVFNKALSAGLSKMGPTDNPRLWSFAAQQIASSAAWQALQEGAKKDGKQSSQPSDSMRPTPSFSLLANTGNGSPSEAGKASSVQPVNIHLNGKTTTLNVSSMSDARTLDGILRLLESDAGRAL